MGVARKDGVWDIRYRVLHYIGTGVLGTNKPQDLSCGRWCMVWDWRRSARRLEIMLIDDYVCVHWVEGLLY
jgi:hypothetical protein